MVSMWRWFAVAAAVLVAILLHTFYVDYKVNAERYLLSWPATPLQRNDLLDKEARSQVRPGNERIEDVGGTTLYDQRAEHINRYCEPTDRYRRQYGNANILDRPWPDPEDSLYWRCSRKFVPTRPKEVKVVIPGVSFVAARASLEKRYASTKFLFGMVPSQIIAGDKPSRTSFVKSYWLGVIVPAALLLFVFFMLVSALRGWVSKGRIEASKQLPNDAERREPHVKEILGAAEAPQNVPPTLADLLKSDFGPDFPVSGGNGKEGSPIVITARTDYVSVEYAVVRHVLAAIGEEYKLSNQTLLGVNGRNIDKLIFNVRKTGSADWEGQRSFYFDITAGFSDLGK